MVIGGWIDGSATTTPDCPNCVRAICSVPGEIDTWGPYKATMSATSIVWPTNRHTDTVPRIATMSCAVSSSSASNWMESGRTVKNTDWFDSCEPHVIRSSSWMDTNSGRGSTTLGCDEIGRYILTSSHIHINLYVMLRVVGETDVYRNVRKRHRLFNRIGPLEITDFKWELREISDAEANFITSIGERKVAVRCAGPALYVKMVWVGVTRLLMTLASSGTHIPNHWYARPSILTIPDHPTVYQNDMSV